MKCRVVMEEGSTRIELLAQTKEERTMLGAILPGDVQATVEKDFDGHPSCSRLSQVRVYLEPVKADA